MSQLADSISIIYYLLLSNSTETIKASEIVTVWSGGFALLAASSIASNVAGGAIGAAGLGAAGVIPALAGLGLVGTAGAGAGLMALSECMRPVLCVAPSGQCCLSTMTRRGFECPQSCWDIPGQSWWPLYFTNYLLSHLYLGLTQPVCRLNIYNLVFSRILIISLPWEAFKDKLN